MPRVMSPVAAFMYNVLAMGLIFPWAYLWAPSSFPEGDIVLGILAATVVEVPLCLAYAWLATALPRSGGSYVFLSRTVGGGIAFTVVFSGFVIWVLQWLAIAGWMLSVLGLAPLAYALGVLLPAPHLLVLAAAFETPGVILAVTVVGGGLAVLLLAFGLRAYVRFQTFMFVGTLLAFGLMLALFFGTSPPAFAQAVDRFAAAGGVRHYYETTVALFKGPRAFSWWQTLAIAPIAWTSLQWSTYSVEQNGEIVGARKFRTQIVVILGATVFTGLLLALLGYAEVRAVGAAFLLGAASAYGHGIERTIGGFTPFPNLLALSLTHSLLVVALLVLGYLLNSFQIFCNSLIGMSRILVAMAEDRLLPAWLGRLHGREAVPMNAYLVYFLAGILWSVAYNFAPNWGTYTLGVTFANGYVFVLAAGVGALMLPYRARELYERTPAPKGVLFGVPWLTWLGAAALLTGGAMVTAFLALPQYGTTGTVPYLLTMGAVLGALVWYSLVRSYWTHRGVALSFDGEAPEES